MILSAVRILVFSRSCRVYRPVSPGSSSPLRGFRPRSCPCLYGSSVAVRQNAVRSDDRSGFTAQRLYTSPSAYRREIPRASGRSQVVSASTLPVVNPATVLKTIRNREAGCLLAEYLRVPVIRIIPEKRNMAQTMQHPVSGTSPLSGNVWVRSTPLEREDLFRRGY